MNLWRAIRGWFAVVFLPPHKRMTPADVERGWRENAAAALMRFGYEPTEENITQLLSEARRHCLPV